MGHNHNCCNKQKVKRGIWSQEEDEILRNYIDKNGTGSWSQVPDLAGLQRCGKSCRMRWINYLRPDLKKGGLSCTEISRLIELHSVCGNRWSVIVKHFPGRTDNEIKNVWNTIIKNKIMTRQKTAKFARKPSANPPTNAHMQQMFIASPPMPLQGFPQFAPTVSRTDPVMINANLAAMALSPSPPVAVCKNFPTVFNLPTWNNLSHIPQTMMNQTQPESFIQNFNSMFGFNNYNTNLMVDTNPQVQAYPMQAQGVPNNSSLFGFGNHNAISFLNAIPQLQAFHNAVPPQHLALNDNPMFGFVNPTQVIHQNICPNNSNLMLAEPVRPNPVAFDEIPFSSAVQEQLVEPIDGLTNFHPARNAGVHPNYIENNESIMRLFESSAPTARNAYSSTSTMPTKNLAPAPFSFLPRADVSDFAPLPCGSPFLETYSTQSWGFQP